MTGPDPLHADTELVIQDILEGDVADEIKRPGYASDEIRDLIQEAIDAAVKPLQEQIAALQGQIAECVTYGAQTALQADGGQFLCAEDGGPATGEPFTLTGRATAGAWETWRVERVG